MKNYENHVTIPNWAEDDRPREKLRQKGRSALSDAELLAIILGTGNRDDTAVDLAKKILKSTSDNLIELSRLGLTELMKFNGVGEAKAISIIAALELGKRRNESEALSRQKISDSKDAFELLRGSLVDKPYEEFWIILLNKANKVIRKCSVSEGGISGTVVDPKKVFKIAIENHASSIILGHNHPSGNILPSDADHKITKKLCEAGGLLEIAVLDHLIIGDDKYYSFADEGHI